MLMVGEYLFGETLVRAFQTFVGVAFELGFQITMVMDGAVDFIGSRPERRVLLRQSCRPRWVVGADTGGLELFGFRPLSSRWLDCWILGCVASGLSIAQSLCL
jgi:hypothetical protein